MNGKLEINIELQDTEWPFEYVDHDREIVRAIVFDDDGYYYFVRAQRDDDFGRATLIETPGGGVENGEDFLSAIKRDYAVRPCRGKGVKRSMPLWILPQRTKRADGGCAGKKRAGAESDTGGQGRNTESSDKGNAFYLGGKDCALFG